MEIAGVEVLIRPGTTIAALTFVGAGITLGIASGLTPGLHANTFALLLAAIAPSLPGPSRLVGAAMLAAGVVHTFLDAVPALALGVPDPAMAPSALPGHQLVIEGRGREALRLSALGSGLAIAFAIPLAIPVTEFMVAVYPTLQANRSLVLGAVAILLILTERRLRGKLGAAAAVGASGVLGILVLDWPTAGLIDVGGMLMPLFTGLFGAPILLDALGGAGVPRQADPVVTTPKRLVAYIALIGTLAGAIVGYLPGISSAIAATASLVVIPRRGPRAFVIATSGVNTANAVFALFALVALGTPRTGVLVAVDRAGVPIDLPLFLASVGIAAAAGFLLVVRLGDRYLAAIGRRDNTRVTIAVLALLTVLVAIFAGLPGLAVFGAATVVGLIPARMGARRASLMGVLLVPLALP